MSISLSDEERQLLIDVLDSEIGEVRSEVYHAESHRVKEILKDREETAKELLERLKRER